MSVREGAVRYVYVCMGTSITNETEDEDVDGPLVAPYLPPIHLEEARPREENLCIGTTVSVGAGMFLCGVMRTRTTGSGPRDAESCESNNARACTHAEGIQHCE